MSNWLDYKTCPTCWAVVLKTEYGKHSCVKQVADSLVAKANEVKEIERQEVEKELKANAKLKGKSVLQLRKMAEDMGIQGFEMMTSKDLQYNILKKEKENV